MHCLAVCELGASLETETEALASLLDVTPYDVRTRLARVLPRIVRLFDDASVAASTCERVRRRGHGAIVFDASDAVAMAQMTRMRRFRTEGDRLFASDAKPPSGSLSEIVAIVSASLSVRVSRITRERVYRATGDGGGDEEESSSSEQATEAVALLFWRQGAAWLMRESEARYAAALGARMRPTAHENFRLAIEWLRARAENAVYDDRFLKRPLHSTRPILLHGASRAPKFLADRAIDQTLHALGTWLGQRRHAGPYR